VVTEEAGKGSGERFALREEWFSLADDGKGTGRLTDGFDALFWGPAVCVMTSCAFPTSGVRPRSSV
jgi:hypothetical protein